MLDCKLAGREGEGEPIFSEECINFNSFIEEGGCETFDIPISATGLPEKNGLLFQFCKTGHHLYDEAVMCCLIIFNHYFKEKFKVSSDGTTYEWQEAMNHCQVKLDYGEDFVLEHSNDD